MQDFIVVPWYNGNETERAVKRKRHVHNIALFLRFTYDVTTMTTTMTAAATAVAAAVSYSGFIAGACLRAT